jgi:hypothetical protein
VDRTRSARLLTRRLYIIAALGAVVLTGAAAPLAVVHLARWLAPGTDPVGPLTTTFAECSRPPADPQGAWLVEVGRTAFRTPQVLGGQAARAGLACESCHQAGRRNPDFFFPHLSGAPGTADVTTALFSSHRDDGIDNPKRIPDLSGPKAVLKVPQDPARPDLAAFIHGQITQEFDGAEPPPAVLAGLAAYVRSLDPAACPTPARGPLRVADQIEDARRAARAALGALDRHDSATAIVMIQGARWRLGLIDERYAAPDLADTHAALHAADLDLAAALGAIRAGDPHAAERLDLWLARSPVWAQLVKREEPRSLFDPAQVAQAAGR